ncbi:protein TrpH [Clostridium aceticum]|uniref:Protein TrpH n=1 Tax=Clostridium aceticum TaxID=84022 RepID=A0A0D8IEM2_9CLOT|nr:PHP domain-containing protein [Clostridium aceticum]AKL95413.1 protein TrpH [Clostridium aceticum]KJF28785.1 phosphotransferase [Clostridium aceticum]
MRYIDMHTHTTASDGVYTPSQLIDYAITKGLSGIAITDHDTVEGINEGISYANKLENFILLGGIELSTEYLGEEVHILGYGINHKSEELLQTLSFIQEQRKSRAAKIVGKLQALSLSITYEEVLSIAKEGAVGRPHVARILVEKGYTENIQETFQRYLNKGCPAYVARYKITPFEAIEIIRKVQGFVVIAHPGLIKNEKILKDILEKKVDGIEVYHPEHGKKEHERFLSVAKQYNLCITAGSDFHSPPKGEGRHGDLGSEKISIDKIDKFIKRI